MRHLTRKALCIGLLSALTPLFPLAGDGYVAPLNTDADAALAIDESKPVSRPANGNGAKDGNAAATGTSPDGATTNAQSAVAPGAPLKVKLKEALTIVANSHPAVLAARNRFDASGYQYEAAQYSGFPAVEVDTGRIGGGSGQSTYRINQPLYTFGRISNNINAAEKRVDSARDAVLEQTRIVQDQAITQYFEVLRTADRLRTARENTEAHRKLEETIRRRNEAGVGSDSDLELARTRLNQARNDEAAAVAAQRKALANLRSLLSVNVSKVEVPSLYNSPYSTEEQLLELAFENSAVVKRLRNEAEAQQYEANAQVAAALPQVVLRAERVEFAAPSNFKDSRIFAAVQFNPGGGLSALSNANAGRARVLAAEQDIAKARRDLSEVARALLSDYQQTQDQLKFLEALKRSNAGLVDAFLRQFQAGKRSWLDVLNAQRESTQSSLSYVDSFYTAQSLAHRMELLATGAVNIGGVVELGDLPTKPRFLEVIMPSLSSKEKKRK